jgi:hypothetical protein
MNPDPDQGYGFLKNPDSDPHKMHADPQPQDLHQIGMRSHLVIKQRLLSFSHFNACHCPEERLVPYQIRLLIIPSAK